MSFRKQPYIALEANANQFITGWDNIAKKINESDGSIIVVECYQGIFMEKWEEWLRANLEYDVFIHTKDLFKKEEEILNLTQADVTDDRVFGYLSRLNMLDFLEEKKLANTRQKLSVLGKKTVVFGFGASLCTEEADVFIYADMARWEIQQRMRKNEVENLGVNNRDEKTEVQYKRAYFLDWRVCDRLKKQVFSKWDFVVDSNDHDSPKMMEGDLYRKALAAAVERPISLVPFFDPGPWGGQWMKEVCGLDREKENYAWCFNCVPEENSMLFKINETFFESPSINLVFFQSRKLLGEAVHARFGDEFPIRFDFLDTMGGGNLSLQVHPSTEYIQEKFGIPYTQDESYYMLDAIPGALVYLGLKEGVDPQEMINDLEKAQEGKVQFDTDKHVEKWEVKKHDHVLIPGGTVHCSGAESMVLEISSTPYIFTFKLWDWGRLGMDGKPRPINIEHGKNVIQWDRTTNWTRKNLVNVVEKIDEGEGWIEERTGLHEREFIETRRFWFTEITQHDTCGGVNVLNLVEGDEAIVESPDNAFEPFLVSYAETFIVPAKVGKYSIRPYGTSIGKELGILKAYVRT